MKNRIWYRGFLRGFFDADGCAICCRYGKPGPRSKTPKMSWKIDASNTDESHIKKIQEALTYLKIEHKTYKVKNRLTKSKHYFTVHITKMNAVMRFKKLVGFTSDRKQRKLEDIVRWVTRPGGRFGSGRPRSRKHTRL